MASVADRDVAIVGGGILGTSVAYWLAARYDGRIVVLEREPRVAEHASRRNTGVIHRPFYLHPQKGKLFARASQVSYGLWKAYAAARDLPFHAVGTYKVALRDADVEILRTNVGWAQENGMAASEVELLDRAALQKREPNLSAAGGLFVKTDTSVDFRAFTEALRADAEAMGAKFLTGAAVERIDTSPDGLTIHFESPMPSLRTRYLVNCAGGECLDIAHAMGLGMEYTDLHFRGEYWAVDGRVADLVARNVYTVPQQPELPFLDPHWIVRANGRREIGPNAVPIAGPRQYDGFGRPIEWVEKFFEPPIANKLRLLASRDFLGLSAREMLSSLSKGEMMRRVQRFLPALRIEHLVERGFAGIRSTVVNAKGAMLKEAVELPGPHSYHVLNYNSPGATGAPAFAAYLVDRLAARGDLDHLTPNPKTRPPWAWDAVAKGMEFLA